MRLKHWSIVTRIEKGIAPNLMFLFKTTIKEKHAEIANRLCFVPKCCLKLAQIFTYPFSFQLLLLVRELFSENNQKDLFLILIKIHMLQNYFKMSGSENFKMYYSEKKQWNLDTFVTGSLKIINQVKNTQKLIKTLNYNIKLHFIKLLLFLTLLSLRSKIKCTSETIFYMILLNFHSLNLFSIRKHSCCQILLHKLHK